MTLKEFFEANPVVALGFSGGVDSSYLLYAGIHYGAKIKAYYIKTAFQPAFEQEDAIRMAAYLGADMTIIEHDVFLEEAVVANPKNRCYHCKTALFQSIKDAAVADGFSLLIDGTNASDDFEDRPGMVALQELAVQSPLRLCGITKKEVRRLSKEAGLFTWNKPAYACLATRVPTGTEITDEILRKVEKSEAELFAMGFTDFRVRIYKDAARLQIKDIEMEKAFTHKEAIIKRLKPYFEIVLLDLISR